MKSEFKNKTVIASKAKHFRLFLGDCFVRASLAMTVVSVLLLTSCNPNALFDENQAVAGEKWDYADAKKFVVNVEDTTAQYTIFINLRHSFAFEWRNVYVKVYTGFPDGHKAESRVNLTLSEPDGHWYANCIGDNCYLSIPIKQNIKFPQKGKYTFTIAQDMRVNPLPLVRNVGLRIEKAEKMEKEE